MLISRLFISVFEFMFGPIAVRVPSGYDPMSAPHIPNVVQPARIVFVLTVSAALCGGLVLGGVVVAQVVGASIPAISQNWSVIMPWLPGVR